MARTNIVPQKSGGVVKWQDKLAALAKESVEQESSVSSGQFINTRAGQLSYNGNPAIDNKMQVVVADFILENAYYEGEFDPDAPQPPVCFAFGRDEKTMAPHKDSAHIQHETCAGCPRNEFGTADRGKGKACKNIRRIGVLPAKPLEAEALQKSEVAYLKTPVTSGKAWAAYVRGLNLLHQRPPQGVVTEVGCIPDAKTQFKLTFNYVKDVPDNLMGIVMQRHDEVRAAIEFPYSPPSSEAPVKKGSTKTPQRKKY